LATGAALATVRSGVAQYAATGQIVLDFFGQTGTRDHNRLLFTTNAQQQD
jgi:hypothetical protein